MELWSRFEKQCTIFTKDLSVHLLVVVQVGPQEVERILSLGDQTRRQLEMELVVSFCEEILLKKSQTRAQTFEQWVKVGALFGAEDVEPLKQKQDFQLLYHLA